MSNIAKIMQQKRQFAALQNLEAHHQGAATAESWMQTDGQYKRGEDFQREIVQPLAASRQISTRGGIIHITDLGQEAIGQRPEVPVAA